MRSFAVINQKGGCGKTTTSINLAASFAQLGKRTLLVDMDPQGHCGLGLAVPEGQVETSMAEALLAPADDFDPADLLWQISSRLDLAPSTVALAAVEQRLSGAADRDRRLAKLLNRVAANYDFCIIDCPPSLGLLTFNALRAAGEVLIPVETGYFAMAGAVKQVATLQVLADRVGHEICFYVLPTMYDVRTNMAREIVSELRRHFGDRVLNVPIHYSSKLKEAASFGQPITEYDPACRGAQDYDRLARQLVATTPMPSRFATATVSALATPLMETSGAPTAVAAPAPAPGAAAATMEHAAAATAVAAAPATVTVDVPAAAAPAAAPGAGSGARPGDRAAELVQRARALADRANQLQEKLNPRPRTDEGDDEAAAANASAKRMQRVYGVQVTGQGALFVQPDRAAARRVCVAGDFNDWSPSATPLQRNSRLGVWEACVDLAPGRYEYKLVVDGKWTPDPYNGRAETNPFGETNSVIEISG